MDTSSQTAPGGPDQELAANWRGPGVLAGTHSSSLSCMAEASKKPHPTEITFSGAGDSAERLRRAYGLVLRAAARASSEHPSVTADNPPVEDETDKEAAGAAG